MIDSSSFLKIRAQDSLLTCGARHPGMLHSLPFLETVATGAVDTLYPGLVDQPAPEFCRFMAPAYRRHIPASLKEQMVIMHLVHGLSKSKIAQAMDVHPSTVRRVVWVARATGSVVRHPLQSGPRRALNGIDCAVSPFPPTNPPEV